MKTEDSVTATDDFFKAFGLDFSRFARSLTYIHTLYGVSEKPMALNEVHVLFRGSDYNGGGILKSQLTSQESILVY